MGKGIITIEDGCVFGCEADEDWVAEDILEMGNYDDNTKKHIDGLGDGEYVFEYELENEQECMDGFPVTPVYQVPYITKVSPPKQ
jgi:hypothetical protein